MGAAGTDVRTGIHKRVKPSDGFDVVCSTERADEIRPNPTNERNATTMIPAGAKRIIRSQVN